MQNKEVKGNVNAKHQRAKLVRSAVIIPLNVKGDLRRASQEKWAENLLCSHGKVFCYNIEKKV